ncbi:MAG: sugar lactone lactonase YvrE [Myxococcota bacterium]|jgi:sugar lactone lactonase YvrE
MRRYAGLGVTLAVLWVLGWLASPGPVQPLAIDVPPHDAARWAPGPWFEGSLRVELSDAHGPEDVEVDAAGRVFAGVADGRILRWDSVDSEPVTLADTGGRPLGLHWAPDGRLIIADAFSGLLAMHPDDGALTTLATRCGGTQLVFTDDVEVAPDGTVWFTDASSRHDQAHWKRDVLETRPAGRLCRWRPGAPEAELVLDGLWFANGIALDGSGQFALVVETSRHRVRKVWIAGPKAGTDSVLIDDLPGYPDGISAGTGGTFWLAIASPRKGALDRLGPWPAARRVVAKLPAWAQPAPERTARVIGIDGDGRVLHDRMDPAGEHIHVVTSVQERGGTLWLGSLVDNAWVRVPRP